MAMALCECGKLSKTAMCVIFHIRLRWRTVNGELVLTDTLIQDVRGLSLPNRQLLQQRGVKGEPFDRLRETSKKVMRMVSVTSALKQPSTGVVPEPSSDNPAAIDQPGQSDQPEEAGGAEQPME